MVRENTKLLIIDSDKAFARKIAEILTPKGFKAILSYRPPIPPPISSSSAIDFQTWRAKKY
jgi:hypothetical protein